ncbi:MAG: hypothetical protein J6J15_04120 [Oscillospiraceae bacterium]|nr:hypothetical protein [Oscillospiraceae bacterium]
MEKMFNDVYSEKDNVKDTNWDKVETLHNKKIESLDEYAEKLDRIIEQKEYNHWNSVEDQERNRKLIDNYDYKKRTADKVSLYTQRSILLENRECFDQDNLNRIWSEIGSNKLEIYNENKFAQDLANDSGKYKVVGLRDTRDGRICVKDTDNIKRLSHTATHETMHDLSFQKKESDSNIESDESGKSIIYNRERFISGIHVAETKNIEINGQIEAKKIEHANRYLNEGFTELYTIREMQKRGENPDFDSYSQEVGWAMQIEEAVGEEIVADAYFGGNLEELKDEFNRMSRIENAWEFINYHIDRYHTTNLVKHKNAVDVVLRELETDNAFVRVRRRV